MCVVDVVGWDFRCENIFFDYIFICIWFVNFLKGILSVNVVLCEFSWYNGGVWGVFYDGIVDGFRWILFKFFFI